MIRILLAIWMAWQTASPEALRHLQAGAEADKQRRFDVAIAEFKKVTELEPNLPDGFLNLGQAYMESQDYGAAIPPLKRAVQLAPDLAAAHQLLGYALLSQGYQCRGNSASGEGPGTNCIRDRADRSRAIAAGSRKSAGSFGQTSQRSRPALLSGSGQRAAYRNNRLILCWLRTRIRRALIRRWLRIISCCDKCPRQRKNSVKPCGFVPTLPNCILNSAWCTRALRSGQKRKKSFALKPSCSRETPRPPIVWAPHSCNKERPARPGLNWSVPIACSRTCPKRYIL